MEKFSYEANGYNRGEVNNFVKEVIAKADAKKAQEVTKLSSYNKPVKRKSTVKSTQDAVLKSPLEMEMEAEAKLKRKSVKRVQK